LEEKYMYHKMNTVSYGEEKREETKEKEQGKLEKRPK